MIFSLFMVVMTLLQPAIEISDVQDRPNDAGDGLHIYLAMPDNTDNLFSLVIYRKEVSQPDSCWRPVLVELIPDIGEFIVDGYDPDYNIEPGVEYMFMPATITAAGDTLI